MRRRLRGLGRGAPVVRRRDGEPEHLPDVGRGEHVARRGLVGDRGAAGRRGGDAAHPLECERRVAPALPLADHGCQFLSLCEGARDARLSRRLGRPLVCCSATGGDGEYEDRQCGGCGGSDPEHVPSDRLGRPWTDPPFGGYQRRVAGGETARRKADPSNEAPGRVVLGGGNDDVAGRDALAEAAILARAVAGEREPEVPARLELAGLAAVGPGLRDPHGRVGWPKVEQAGVVAPEDDVVEGRALRGIPAERDALAPRGPLPSCARPPASSSRRAAWPSSPCAAWSRRLPPSRAPSAASPSGGWPPGAASGRRRPSQAMASSGSSPAGSPTPEPDEPSGVESSVAPAPTTVTGAVSPDER